MNDIPFFIDETDHEILMHKEVHFSGSFSLMLEYYENENKGIQEAFDVERIERLAEVDKTSSTPLTLLILTEEEQEEVLRAKNTYQSLQKLYDLPPSPAQKLADLILSEEEDPEKEIEAICELIPNAISMLIPLIQGDDFYNPLFPGYGLAPAHASQCLGRLKAKEAIIPLFEALPKTEFFGEESILQALFQIGEPAKEFLLSVVKKTPLTKENENAAIALLPFKEDPLVLSTCLDLLELPIVQKKNSLFAYLLFICDSITDKNQIERLKNLSSLPLAPDLQEELLFTLKSLPKTS